jgi:hypothetical protein
MVAGPLMAVFLSAGVPDHAPFDAQLAPVSVRKAAQGLIAAIIRNRHVVFGGHPAISSLLQRAARTLNAIAYVTIFQSEYFRAVVPPEASAFPYLHWTPARSTKEESLRVMREAMINFVPYEAAVLVGGMEGVIEEARLFEDAHRLAPAYPVASTGGAARMLWERGFGPADPAVRGMLMSKTRYRVLFRHLFP